MTNSRFGEQGQGTKDHTQSGILGADAPKAKADAWNSNTAALDTAMATTSQESVEPSPWEEAPTTEIRSLRSRIGSTLPNGARIRDLLGVGGMAAVYLVDGAPSGFRGIKVLHPRWNIDPEERARFLAEAQLMAGFDHPHIVKVGALGELDDHCPFFEIELLEGAPLDEMLKSKSDQCGLDAKEVMYLIHVLLEALQYTHEQGYVHRDVKPANLFVCEDGSAKLLDFGTALLLASVDPNDDEGARLGTPTYMAPEQAVNATRGVDARSDIFAVGASAFEMLSGEPIRGYGTSDENFITAATTAPPSLGRVAADLSPDVIAIVDKALAWSPTDRWESAKAMLVAIDAADLAADGADSLIRSANRANFKASLQPMSGEKELSNEERLKTERFLRELGSRLHNVMTDSVRKELEKEKRDERFQTFFETVKRIASESPDGIRYELRPYSFEYRGLTMWEPKAPLDVIPYNLFQSGFRSLEIEASVSFEEVEKLVRLMQLDPLQDLPSDDDLGTYFLLQDFEHVRAQIVAPFDPDLLDEVGGMAKEFKEVQGELGDEFLAASRELQELGQSAGEAGVAEMQAMAQKLTVETEAGVDWLDAHPETLELRRTYESESKLDRKNALLLLSDIYAAAFDSNEVEAFLKPYSERVRLLLIADSEQELAEELCRLLESWKPEMKRPLLERILRSEVASRVLKGAAGAYSEGGMICEQVGFRDLLELINERFPEAVISFVCDFPESQSTIVITSWWSERLEEELNQSRERFELLNEGAALKYIDAIARSESDVRFRVLDAAERHPDLQVRDRALTWRLAQGDRHAITPLGDRFQSDDSRGRRSALELVKRFKVGQVFSNIEAFILSPAFHALTLEERREIIAWLPLYRIDKAEEIVVKLMQPESWMGLSPSDETREAVITLIGERNWCRKPFVEALEVEAKRLIRSNRNIRKAAKASLARLKGQEGGAS